MNFICHNFQIEHIPDNDAAYFTMLRGAIDSVDNFYVLDVTKNPNGYSIRISLSTPNMENVLISQLNNLNNSLFLRVEYSKSVKKGNVFFQIRFGN